MAHDHEAYDHIGLSSNATQGDCKQQYFFDYKDPKISFMPIKILEYFGYFILFIGAANHYAGVVYDPTIFQVIVFISNIILNYPSLYKINYR